MKGLLEQLVEENRPFARQGRVADYIPELSKADPRELGICLLSQDGEEQAAGDFQRVFTMQSMVKPILLLLALLDNGEEAVRAQIGVEATGKPFDAINDAEQELLSEHLNPMVNMGAILLSTRIRGENSAERFRRLLDFTRQLADNPDLAVIQAVYESEKKNGSRNRAMAVRRAPESRCFRNGTPAM